MKPVYLIAHNIYSPLGHNSDTNFSKVMQGESGIRAITDERLSPEPFYAAMFPHETDPQNDTFTRFEQYCVASIADALSPTGVQLTNPDTLFILSTTKGNIALTERQPMTEKLRRAVSLQGTAQKIAAHFGAINRPIVVSNACISGLLAIIIAERLLQAGRYQHVVVTGADVLSKFIISGFQSLHAMSAGMCRPFDEARNGINLGECAATLVLSADPTLTGSRKIVLRGNASSNDANHISGPSRTGHELAQAVQVAMHESQLSATDLSFISAHGTATVYNDEMEAKAFAHAGLSAVPVHSLKGYFGHTLGAAGVLESVLTCQSLAAGVILPTKNFNSSGVSAPIHINNRLTKSDKTHALKTASGFGGCNAAILYSIL